MFSIMSTVSVPEKTLEHWASLYLTYRYRSHASMWWPTTGADIDVRSFPSRPGKAVQLELKTTVVSGANFHDVLVNLGQLWDYTKLSLARQPYYVFPWPKWTGHLASEARLAGVAPTEIAFKRSGPDWWFADWMVVLTTAQVATVLAGELAAHGSSKRKGSTTRLVRYDLSTVTTTRTWGATAAEPPVVPWRQFWTDLQACGRDGWPQIVRIPTRLIDKPLFRRDEIRILLALSLPFVAESSKRELEFTTLGPSDESPAGEPDMFAVLEEADAEREAPSLPIDPPSEVDADRRQAVFIDAGARQTG